MSQMKPFAAVVGDDESVSRKTGDDFRLMFDSIPFYLPACLVLDAERNVFNVPLGYAQTQGAVFI
jgi:hypothetical protein